MDCITAADIYLMFSHVHWDAVKAFLTSGASLRSILYLSIHYLVWLVELPKVLRVYIYIHIFITESGVRESETIYGARGGEEEEGEKNWLKTLGDEAASVKIWKGSWLEWWWQHGGSAGRHLICSATVCELCLVLFACTTENPLGCCWPCYILRQPSIYRQLQTSALDPELQMYMRVLALFSEQLSRTITLFPALNKNLCILLTLRLDLPIVQL